MHQGKIEKSKLQITQAIEMLHEAVKTIREAQEYKANDVEQGLEEAEGRGRQ